jgi:hypothetical protein
VAHVHSADVTRLHSTRGSRPCRAVLVLRGAARERTPERSPLSGRATQPVAALPWWRWNKVRLSSIRGREATHRASRGRRQLTEASCQREGWKNRDGGGVLRRGGGSGGWRGPASCGEGEEAQAQVCLEKKAARGGGVLGAPLTVEGFTTAEAARQRRWRARTEARHSDNDVVSFGHGRRLGRDGRA